MNNVVQYTPLNQSRYPASYYMLPWTIPDLPKKLTGQVMTSWQMVDLERKAIEIAWEAKKAQREASKAYDQAKKAHFDKLALLEEANGKRCRANGLARQARAHFEAVVNAFPLKT